MKICPSLKTYKRVWKFSNGKLHIYFNNKNMIGEGIIKLFDFYTSVWIGFIKSQFFGGNHVHRYSLRLQDPSRPPWSGEEMYNKNGKCQTLSCLAFLRQQALSHPSWSWYQGCNRVLACFSKGRVQKKKMREKYGLLPNLPRTPPPGLVFFPKKNWPPFFLLKISSTMAKTNFSPKKI